MTGKTVGDRELRTSELRSLMELMLDGDEVTARLVRNRLKSLGWKALNYCINNIEDVIPVRSRAAVRRSLQGLSAECCLDELQALLAAGPFFFVPDGLYVLSRILMPELTPGDFHDCYIEPAGDLVSELRDGMTAVEKVEMLNYIVFDRYGFELLKDMWHGHEALVLIPEIMESRRVGVVGVSTVYFLLASYAGLPVYPVFPKSPGYFVAYFEGERTLFSMDMGNRGRISDPVPRRMWLPTDFMGTDRTILYLYATALRRFGHTPLSWLQVSLLDRAIEMLKL